MRVVDLLEVFRGKLKLESGDSSAEVSSVQYDSRKVSGGSLFVAVEGLVSDGHSYAGQCVEKGAGCILVSRKKAHEFLSSGCCVISAEDTRDALSYVSSFFYGNVSAEIPVIGVTGTNGKTSTTYMLEAVFLSAGFKPGIIGTVAYRWNGKEVPAPNTTPESRDIQALFYEMRNDGVDAIIMEVSSHGLALGRVNDIHFQGGVFTNLTRDHLDYHKTFDEYFAAKSILFSLIEKSKRQNKFACINFEDEYGKKILSSSGNYSYPFFSFGSDSGADYAPAEGSLRTEISSVNYVIKKGASQNDVKIPMGGKFTFYNSLAALSAACSFGISLADAAEGISKIKNVPGRFERVNEEADFSVIVDYAHTNDAMEKLLSSARELNPARIITVFGCGGDRDKTKRPLMGRVAGTYSDIPVVTSDNPRTENADDIIKDILSGMSEFSGKTVIEPDRKKAIQFAVESARKGDLIVIAGKGHEDYQIIGREKYHFDDREVAAEFMRRLRERTA